VGCAHTITACKFSGVLPRFTPCTSQAVRVPVYLSGSVVLCVNWIFGPTAKKPPPVATSTSDGQAAKAISVNHAKRFWLVQLPHVSLEL
jgi:hypothetical protein